MKLRWMLAALGVVSVLAGMRLHRYVPPFAIFFTYFFICLLVLSRHLRAGRLVVHNFAFVFLALACFELYDKWTEGDAARVEYRYETRDYYQYDTINYRHDDAELGFGHSPRDRVVRARKWRDGSLIYDVNYTFDQYGLRKTGGGSDGRTVFFFGDSFTFGEGINDEETLPQSYSNVTGARAFNFAVQGYGAHQMLRMLEIDRPKVLGDIAPHLIVFLTMPDHIARAMGIKFWDRFGPHYEVVDGEARYLGPFRKKGRWSRLADRLASRTYRALAGKSETVSEFDRQRLLAILVRASKLSRAKYGAPFVVILWGDDDNEAWIARHLAQSGIPLFRVRTAVPAVISSEYTIPGDGHPTGRAYSLVAAALGPFVQSYLNGSTSETPRGSKD